MKLEDYRGKDITLSALALEHIQLLHPEIVIDFIKEALSDPVEVRKSTQKDCTLLYYAVRIRTEKKIRYTCVVVKERRDGCFIDTAMTSSNMKKGEVVYQKESDDKNDLTLQ